MPVSTSFATCLHCKPDFQSRAITLSEFFWVENSSRNVIFLNHLKHINIGMVAKICPYKWEIIANKSLFTGFFSELFIK